MTAGPSAPRPVTSRPHPGFVVAGESLVDRIVAASGEIRESVGGSPTNVAVGLARLDVPTLLLTELGDDAHGRRVREHLRASGARVEATPAARTSTATAHLDTQRAASYQFDLTWAIPRRALPAARGLHVGSLGTSLDPGRAAVLDLVEQAAARELCVSFDPNVRPAFVTDRDAAWDDLVATAGRATVVKVSEEDLQVLRPDATPETVAAGLLGGERTELVVLTLGAGGSVACRPGERLAQPATPVEVVDTVGAGDAFTAGLVAALMATDLLRPGAVAAATAARVGTVLRAAAQVAAVTCGRRGANPPTRQELLRARARPVPPG